MDKEFYQGVSRNVEDKSQYNAYRKKYKKEPVLFRMNRGPLHREHQCPGKPCKYIDKKEIDDPHVG